MKTRFTQKVLAVVSKIKPGKVLTYSQVAKKAGNPKAQRAVGNILNKNRSSLVPCHRVVKSNGEIGGFNRGRKIKKELLKKEGINIRNNRIIFS